MVKHPSEYFYRYDFKGYQLVDVETKKPLQNTKV